MTDADKDWVNRGTDGALAGRPTVPAFLEVAPETFKALEACSVDELVAAGESRMIPAKALMDESGRLLELAEQRRRSEGDEAR